LDGGNLPESLLLKRCTFISIMEENTYTVRAMEHTN
jgi:hypothetical protein